MKTKLKPLFSRRFLKFAVVGATGVAVNLGCLALFARALGLQTNLASGLAIELSVVNNFLWNDIWTFKDRRHSASPFLRRVLHFHAVSLVGSLAQFLIFVAGNVLWMYATWTRAGIDAYFATAGGWFARFVLHPLFAPPEVGKLMYLSQLAGIVAGMLWNFFANFHWTWRVERDE